MGALVAAGVLSEDQARRAAAHALGVPFVALDHDTLSLDALVLIPEPVARSRGAVAYRAGDGAVEVALLDLDVLPALDFLSRTHKVLPRLTTQDSITFALRRYQKHLKETLGERLSREVQAIVPPESNSLRDITYAAERLAAARVVDALIAQALHARASDVHLESGEKGLLVRYRVRGSLHDAMVLPAYAAASICARLKLLARLPLGGAGMPAEGRFKIEGDSGAVSVRVVAMPTLGGEKIVLHLAREAQGRRGFTLESLGFHGEGLEALRRALHARGGLIVVAGERQSGKTTALYTMLDQLLSSELAVAAVEDSIEVHMPGVAQTALNEKLGLTSAAALRAALRQDPDVVMVSRIADAEAAALAAHAAARGVLVIAGVDAPSAAEGIAALRAQGAPAELLASSLRAAVGLALIPKLCTKQFGDKRKLTRAQSDALESRADFARVLSALKEEGRAAPDVPWKDVQFPVAAECSSCDGGYSGVLGVGEVLPASSAIAALIEKGEEGERIERQARKEGMLSLVEDALYKAASGLTTPEAVIKLIKALI